MRGLVFISGCIAVMLGVVVFLANSNSPYWLRQQMTRARVSLRPALVSESKVLVLVLTQPSNESKTRALLIKQTWGSRLDKLLFISNSYDPDLPTLNMTFPQGPDSLALKVFSALDYIYENYLDAYDWFLCTDDDTYVIVENLRYFLSDKNPLDPVYYGQIFSLYVKQGYPQGGAGYVLSREALRRFGQRPNASCPLVQNEADVEVGRCLEVVGVPAQDALDNDGRTLLHVFKPDVQISGELPAWFSEYDKHKGRYKQVSQYVISFHYLTLQDMKELEFFIYHFRRYDKNESSV